MKLIRGRYASSWERKHAFASEDAVIQVRQHLASGQNIEGMDQLRSFLMLNVEHEVLQQVQSGEWLLIKPEAYYFDWGQFEKSMFEQRVMDLMSAAPPHAKPPAIQVFHVADSETAQSLDNRRCVVTGHTAKRPIDGLGITHIPEPAEGERIELRVI